MYSILLLIPDFRLRQLYHDLLMTENIEIFPVSKVENAILVESITKFSLLVMHTDDIEPSLVKSLLRLQKRIEKFNDIDVILLTADESAYVKLLTKNDLILNISRLTPKETSDKIWGCLFK
jgi:hypothetical protein